MDPLVPIVAKAADALAESGKEGARSFISAVLKAPGEALGGLFADLINERRHANLIKITGRSQERLSNAGVSAKEVPLSIIHPALQAASLEEEPDLQEIWANLLANAADPRETTPLSPSFPAILKELSAREVRLLDTLFQEASDEVKRSRRPDPARVGFTEAQLKSALSKAGLSRFRMPQLPISDAATAEKLLEERDADERELSICMDALRRQELLVQNVGMKEKKENIKGTTRGISYTLPNNTYSLTRTHSFTRLGIAFVNACRPPEPTGKQVSPKP